jgi:hypothetical protein
MLQPITVRRRRCNICQENINSPPLNDKKSHNCVSLGTQLIGATPDLCWQHLKNPFSHEILATIPAYAQKGQRSDLAHETRIKLGLAVLELAASGLPTESQWDGLIQKFGFKTLATFSGLLPESSILRQTLDPILTKLPPEARKPHRPEKPCLPIPDEFEAAVQLFEQKTIGLYEIKLQRGHKYHEKTVKRRVRDARNLCEFLAIRGLKFWPEVSQHDLDEFIIQTSSGAGARAYTFLLFVRTQFKLTQQFIRPKQILKPPNDIFYDQEVTREVLKKIVSHQDLQVVIAALFLTLLGQTIARSATLTLDDFRRSRHGKLEAKFAEDWMPIDKLTERYLCLYRPNIGEPLLTASAQVLFTYPVGQMQKAVIKLVGVNLKRLRMTAVANIIRSGVTDRGAITRLLGVAINSVAYIEQGFQWDLQSTVPLDVVEARNEVIRGERTE